MNAVYEKNNVFAPFMWKTHTYTCYTLLQHVHMYYKA